MKKNKQIGKNVKQLSLEEIERLELLKKVHEKKGRQLTFSDETGSLKEVDELRQLIGKQFEDPEEKYNIYYVGIRKLLMDYLPKGKAYEEMRQIIYDEKNIFLNPAITEANTIIKTKLKNPLVSTVKLVRIWVV